MLVFVPASCVSPTTRTASSSPSAGTLARSSSPEPASPPIALAPPSAVPPTESNGREDTLTLIDDPPPLDDTERRKFDVLCALCPLAVEITGGHAEVGCRTCFGDGQAPPDGKIQLNPERMYRAHQVVAGSFTAPGTSELALPMEGCEPHSANWGGLLIVKAGAPPTVAGYFSGVHPDRCEPYPRRDGTTLLVCARADGHQGIGSDIVFTFDVARVTTDDPESGFTTVIRTEDDTVSGCRGEASPATDVHQARVTGFSLRDVNGDHVDDLVVQVDYRRGKSGPKYLAACERFRGGLAADGGPPELDHPLGPGIHRSLKFLFDGVHFAATRESAAIMADF
ncbi:MAG TPA: hypothetical protein VF395_15020 [Polyangiaceae bacterium]